MISKAWIFGLVPVALAVSLARSGEQRCGTRGPSNDYLALVKERQAMMQEMKLSRNFTDTVAAGLTVDLFIHVVARSQSHEDGYLTQKELDDQVAVIQSNFAPTGIQFNVIGTDFTVNASWTTAPDNKMNEEMKWALHKGDYRTLNLYFVNDLGPYGNSTLPQQWANYSQETKLRLDGCLVRPTTVPGGSIEHVNQGKTATHEIGHWFGLWHTFEAQGDQPPPNRPSGCKGIGDEVDDTPAQREATSGCPDRFDSCPELPGDDPVHNYMNYEYDECMYEFTPGQTTRMFMIWQKYRATA